MAKYNQFTRKIVSKYPEDPLDVKATPRRCEHCGSRDVEVRHRAGDGYLPEAYWNYCYDCEQEGEPV